jgi:hypothetical protein
LLVDADPSTVFPGIAPREKDQPDLAEQLRTSTMPSRRH